MIGREEQIVKTCSDNGIDAGVFTVVGAEDERDAAGMAVRMTRAGETDIVMKGLVGTDKFLKAVMDKEHGLLPPKSVMSLAMNC